DGGAGDDEVYGEGGDDFITGAGGDDLLVGDASWTPATERGNDYIDGEGGLFAILFYTTNPVTKHLSERPVTAGTW
ncbi:MAG: hypothetical protein AABY45_05865, partial [Deltaproteobacteria bacterium]